MEVNCRHSQGDLNNFSADYSTIDPTSQGQQAPPARLLPWAEGLATIVGWNDAGFQNPARLIERAFTRLFDYDEHSGLPSPRPVMSSFLMRRG
jgi:hypothetical protein